MNEIHALPFLFVLISKYDQNKYNYKIFCLKNWIYVQFIALRIPMTNKLSEWLIKS